MTIKCDECGRELTFEKSIRCECGAHHKVIDD